MKAFEFAIPNYEAERNGNTLFIWEMDDEGDRLKVQPLEISITDLYSLIEESNTLQRWHNPTCADVTNERAHLENARGDKTEGSFDLALKAYMDIATRHREASDCTVLH